VEALDSRQTIFDHLLLLFGSLSPAEFPAPDKPIQPILPEHSSGVGFRRTHETAHAQSHPQTGYLARGSSALFDLGKQFCLFFRITACFFPVNVSSESQPAFDIVKRNFLPLTNKFRTNN
jgi:hypothetical protein